MCRAVLQICLLAHREDGLDRIQLRDGGELRRGVDEVADLGDGDAGDAGDGRGDPGPAEVQLRLFDLRLRRLHGGQVRLIGLHRVVERAGSLGHGVGTGECPD